MQLMYSETHLGTKVDLTEHSPKLCAFTDCTLIARNEAPREDLGLGSNVYIRCRFVGPGWPEWVKTYGQWTAH